MLNPPPVWPDLNANYIFIVNRLVNIVKNYSLKSTLLLLLVRICHLFSTFSIKTFSCFFCWYKTFAQQPTNFDQDFLANILWALSVHYLNCCIVLKARLYIYVTVSFLILEYVQTKKNIQETRITWVGRWRNQSENNFTGIWLV